jgi:hypothetical protein
MSAYDFSLRLQAYTLAFEAAGNCVGVSIVTVNSCTLPTRFPQLLYGSPLGSSIL